jgi:hypothetical protein
MGEAKRREKELRDEFLKEADRWSFPPSEWEQKVVAELQAAEPIWVERMPREQVDWMRMPPGKCHANAQWYEDNDPSKTFKAVAGWLVDPEGNYVFHSVVSDGENYACITPSRADPRPMFEFIPDPKVTWYDDDATGYRRALRDGGDIGAGVRSDPEKTIADCERIRQKLLAGVHPMKAIEIE